MTKKSYTILITALIFFLFVISSLLAEPAKISRIEPPDDLDIILTGNDIELIWNTIPGATYYNIFRCGSINGTYSIIDTTIYTSYVDTDAGLESKYFYYVTAYTPFQWCPIPSGVNYKYGEGDTLKTMDHAFQIMNYEVTNEQYLAYLQGAYEEGHVWMDGDYVKGNYEGDDHWSAGEQTFYWLGTPDYINCHYARIDFDDVSDSFILTVNPGDTVSQFYNHPVTNVSWFGAWHYAKYYQMQLPTEYEWECSARGDNGNDYPWGDDVDTTRANYWDSFDPWDNGTTPIGMYNGETTNNFPTSDSPSPYGLYDMAGNAEEWTASWQGNDYPSSRVLRGGSWVDNTDHIQSWWRNHTYPSFGGRDRGFRCVIRSGK